VQEQQVRQQAQLGRWGLLALRAQRVLLDPVQVRLVRLDPRERLDLLVQRVLLDRQDHWVRRVLLALLDLRELPVLLDNLPVLRVQQAVLVRQVQQVQRVHQEQPDPRELLVLQAELVQRVPLEQRALLELLELQELRDLRVRRAPSVLLELLGRAILRVQREQWVQQVLVQRVTPVQPVQRVTRARQELREGQALQVRPPLRDLTSPPTEEMLPEPV